MSVGGIVRGGTEKEKEKGITQSTQRKSTEDTEKRVKAGEVADFDRKSPPFAEGTKGGAPSSSVVEWINWRSKSTG
jgi:hypothetical protein